MKHIQIRKLPGTCITLFSIIAPENIMFIHRFNKALLHSFVVSVMSLFTLNDFTLIILHLTHQKLRKRSGERGLEGPEEGVRRVRRVRRKGSGGRAKGVRRKGSGGGLEVYTSADNEKLGSGSGRPKNSFPSTDKEENDGQMRILKRSCRQFNGVP